MRRPALPMVVLGAVYLAQCLHVAVAGWERAWARLAVHTMPPGFADLRTVQGALSSLQQGLDPFLENPGDPWGRPLNYPPIWLAIGRLAALDVEWRYQAFVLCLELACVVALLHFLRSFPSWFLMACMASGAVLMGMERGNSDLLMFAMLYAALCARSYPWRAGLVLMASVLKLFPIVAVFALIEPGGASWWWRARYALGVLGAFLVYVALEFEPLLRGIEATPFAGSMSYGVAVLAFLVEERAPALSSFGRLPFYATFGVVALATVLWRAPLARALPPAGVSSPEPADRFNITAMLVGAGIYVLTFLQGGSWDYRMLFCLLCFPYMNAVAWRSVRVAFQACLLLALNQFLLVALLGVPGGALCVLGKWALALLLMAAALLELLTTLGAGAPAQPLTDPRSG